MSLFSRVHPLVIGWSAVALLLVLSTAGCSDDAESLKPVEENRQREPLTTTASEGDVHMTVTVDARRMTVGEKITLEIEAEAPQNVQVQMPVIDDTLGPFTVRDRRTPPDVPVDGVRQWRHVFVLDTFASGPAEIPALELVYTDTRVDESDEQGNATTGIVTAGPLTIDVQSVLAGTETDEDFRDIRGAIDVPVPTHRRWFTLLLIAVVVLIVSAAAVWLIAMRRRRSPMTTLAATDEPPHVQALRLLDQLQAEQLVKTGRFQAYYQRLSDIVRWYIEARFGLRAPERTTDEFLREAGRDSRLTTAQRDLLASFLRSSDLVKFARIDPDATEARDALVRARGFIEETAPRARVQPESSAAEQITEASA